jgi:mycothiol system anti-sigma-R factor
MYNCAEIRDRLSLYLDNELLGEDRVSFAAHLDSCEECRRMFEQEQEFLQTIRQARPEQNASPELRAKVTKLFEEDQNAVGQVTARVSKKPLRVGLAIAATLLILLSPLIILKFSAEDRNQLAGQPSSFALMATETHLRRIRGQLPLEIESASPIEISSWFANKVNFSVKLPNYQESSGQNKLYVLEGARLVGFKDDYAAYVAYRMGASTISLVITSDTVAKPSGGEEIAASGLNFHYDAIQGLKVITWSDRGLTYALVSDLEERGQQSCIVCHQGTQDRNFIEQLKPRS